MNEYTLNILREQLADTEASVTYYENSIINMKKDGLQKHDIFKITVENYEYDKRRKTYFYNRLK